jgi:hypothetical protein
MRPEPPPILSITTLCPSCAASAAWMTRPNVSTPPPAGHGTMSLMAWFG